ncbi:MAG TPA: GWxTD domain-containing protein [Thermoanaerobaculia bacterium]|nr:GWxTD domain-containing protein [Thermoanaerobaculia bacterium]
MLVAVLTLAAPLFARLSKYRGWESSPEGYFMTRAERDQWSKIDTDADAEKFIADFHARRADNFEKEVADRAANADKYLTVGKTQGSKSLRGRIVIVLGPPSQMDVADRTLTSSKSDSGAMAGAMSNMNGTDSGGSAGNGNRGGGGGDSVNSIGTTMSTAKVVRVMHLNYQGAVATTADRKQIDVNVEIDPTTGKDRIPSRSEESEVNSALELVAQSWIKK